MTFKCAVDFIPGFKLSLGYNTADSDRIKLSGLKRL